MKKENLGNTDRLIAVYDLYSYAPTFNIYEFLTGAKIYANEKKINAIDILIVKRNISEALIYQPQAKPEYDFRINDILINSISMFPVKNIYKMDSNKITRDLINSYELKFPENFSLDISSNKKNNDRYFLQPYLRDYFLAGFPVPSITTPVFAYKTIKNILKNRRIITITIRNAKHLTEKNSNIETWKRVKKHFTDQGYDVINIEDLETLNGTNNVDQNSIFSHLSIANQSYRSAVYDAAVLNLGVNNGAIAPLMFNANARMLIAKTYTGKTNTSQEIFSELTGITKYGDSWSRVPWHKFILNNNEDSNEIIQYSSSLITETTQIENKLKIDGKLHPLLTDPLGKLDGSIFPKYKDWIANADFSLELFKKLIIVLLKEEEMFGSVKSLIIRSISLLMQKKNDLSLQLAKQAMLIDGRYADSYIISAIINSGKTNSQYTDKIIASTIGLEAIFFGLDNNNIWRLNVSDEIANILNDWNHSNI